MSDMEPTAAYGAPPGISLSGLPGDFFLLQLGNMGLNIITLGIHRFWGKTRYRRHLWGNTLIDGDPLEYRGRGLELFIGAVLVIFLVSIPFGLLSFVMPLLFKNPALAIGVTQLVVIVLLYYLVGVGQYRSWRYLLSRTSWRGIRAGMTEGGWRFGLYNFGLILAQIFSLSLATPWVGTKRWNRMVGDVRIGSMAMSADADWRPVFKKFLIVWGLVFIPLFAFYGWFFYQYGHVFMHPKGRPPTPENSKELLVAIGVLYAGILGIGLLGALIFAQYHAAFLREIYGKTRIGNDMTLRVDVTTGDVIRYFLGNAALVIFTFSIGSLMLPWRHWRFLAGRMSIEGRYDEAALMQTDLDGPIQGDGLADAFDLSPF
jgi:uncharacterized membrane protein YjgN (DUF898 family)